MFAGRQHAVSPLIEADPALLLCCAADGGGQALHLPGFFEIRAGGRQAGAGLNHGVDFEGFQLVVTQLMPRRRAEGGIARPVGA